MQIAFAGCGIAGATAAFLLADSGHEVTVFEQAAECGPVGAGILLQPSGQRILKTLGLYDAVLKDSARVDELQAQHRSGKDLIRIRYARAAEELFGLGVHRGVLFSLLFDRCQASGVSVVNGCRVKSYSQDGSRVELTDDAERSLGRFDLFVVADGSNSTVRRQSSLPVRTREYDYAAMWTTGPCTAVEGKLLQVVEGARQLIGLLPIGEGRCSFFWGLRCADRDRIWSGGVESWKSQCVAFCPMTEEVVSAIRSFDEVTYATYRNVRMRRPIDGRTVFIGDAAHATSPHLGQGVNLALADAVCLVSQLAQSAPDEALAGYVRARVATTSFYATLTGVLTPFFQSDSVIRGWGRDMCLPWMPQLPYIGRQMALTMAGLKTGWLTDSL